ncbi:FAD/NAD(P)-binding domain-containing protein [Mollisia scopiformis]|uniref:FAD/NAD(P)-binding domain-containing protein n=1 Tax=Mollisia scopiformis TaxID=149040 RepID=A0A132B5H8_MOLSC|nr:FAD/NAD(P)-binding domain-containing protein [Mollisia scopiformis]KUJ07660.1 FAD/NAD(P)-binding domain-containing protein [Mollisia scopiformis]
MRNLSFLIYLALAVCISADWSTETWDLIVVGAGPAGIIVSHRMASAGLKTLLLEGGRTSYGITGGDLDSRRPAWLDGTNLTRVDVPGLYKSIFSDQGNLRCTGLTNAFGGCTVGGSSAINAGLFFEPPASDYNLYYPAGWKSADMKNATRRLYSMQPASNLTSQDDVRYLQTGYNAARQWIIFGYPIFDYANGQRGGPVVTYLQEALALTNFHMETGALGTRTERVGCTVTGVTLINDRAGALRSPALLMFSGIGPADELERLQAAGKLSPDLPVSSWLNHSSVGAALFDNPNTFIALQNGSIQSYTYSTGPYTFASETSVFWDTLARPDGSIAGFRGTIDSSGFGDFNGNDAMTLNVYGTSGLKSTGSVVLDSNFIPGPDGKVCYSNPQDAEDISGFIYKIFQGLPAAGLASLNIPQNSTAKEIEAYITSNVGEVNHWSSSCRMGVFEDTPCVTNDTTVYGMNNLDVVDGSIIPPLTVNPQFGIMAAAERASEIILRKWYGLEILRRAHENREILFKKASSCLPNFPKRSTDFYVAILPSNKSVRTGEWKDFFWLRARGKYTVAQVKKFYAKASGSNVIFMDGARVVAEHTQIQSLNHLKTDLVALWTVSAERRPLGEVAPSKQNSLSGNEHSSRSTGRTTVGSAKACSVHLDCQNHFLISMTDFTPEINKHLTSHNHGERLRNRTLKIRNLRRLLREINADHPTSEFTVSEAEAAVSALPIIKCSACLEWQHQVMAQERSSDAIDSVEAHIVSAGHKAKLHKFAPARLDSLSNHDASGAEEMETYHNARSVLKRKRAESPDGGTQNFQRSSEDAFTSSGTSWFQALASEYPEDRFQVSRIGAEEMFRCLDCFRTLSSKADIRNMKQHLDSGGHKYRVASRQGKFKKQKKR